ncbi:hypothetical protein B0I33_104226 [Prauserella shujinwangii]|uniref:VOC domain-containing protein n=1 Tax=Prauserella shujinwangii TaxID=1453103 RepID=A0A2T0LWL4_9PSEU|nr:VOC family protein [Prauserella shujinwangii]PRX48410.1 hypothetical protein B0I33_104226 [Prauserella shujinwangii]
MSVGSPTQQSVVPAGMPCWVELAASDETAAQRFYAELFGWEFRLRRDPATLTRRYNIATLGEYEVAGLYQAASDQPTGWIVHLAVTNSASVADWVEHLGGLVTLGPVDIPDRGSIVHALDAGGAPVVFWQPSDSWSFVTGVPGAFSGADLNTYDGEKTDNFYCRMFSFTSEQIGSGGIDYAEWRLDHGPVIYRYQMGDEYRESTRPHWMVYFCVDPARGTDAVAGQAIMLGGSVLTPPFDTPFGRTAVIADPNGSVLSIIDHESAVDNGAGRAEVDDPYGD